MYTDIQFINYSLNPHLPKAGLFFDGGIGRRGKGAKPDTLLWHLIQKCGFHWRHPIRIHWDFACQFYDKSGNSIARKELPDPSAGRRRKLNVAARLGVDLNIVTVGGQEVLRVAKTGKSRVHRVELLKNGIPVAARRLSRPETAVSFDLTNTLSLCADMRLDEGDGIEPNNVNITRRTFDLMGLRSVTIYMKGGEPGPSSGPIYFAISQIKRW
jgi:hypothetical protein